VLFLNEGKKKIDETQALSSYLLHTVAIRDGNDSNVYLDHATILGPAEQFVWVNWVQPLQATYLPLGRRGEPQNLGRRICYLPSCWTEPRGRPVPRPRTYVRTSRLSWRGDRARLWRDGSLPVCGVGSRGGGWAASLRPGSLPVPRGGWSAHVRARGFSCAGAENYCDRFRAGNSLCPGRYSSMRFV
jgi:hypothetical protein